MWTFTQINIVYVTLPERRIYSTCSGTYLPDEGCVRCFANEEYEASIIIDSRRSINEAVNTGKKPTESEAGEIPDISLLKEKTVQLFSKSNSFSSDVIDYGDDEVERHFSSKDNENSSEQSDADGKAESLDNFNGKDIINGAITKYKEKIANAPDNTIIVQRNEQKFWNVFFRNRIDLSMFDLRVIFAGEGAVEDGGPFREFLRLSMQNLPKLSRMVFGEENQLFFTASPVDVADKCYYKLGQLSALSILSFGRGLHCFQDKLVDAIFSKNVEGVKVNDASFLETMKQIDEGNFDPLVSAGIAPVDIEKAKKLYALHYAILSRYAAINDFRSRVESISKSIIEN